MEIHDGMDRPDRRMQEAQERQAIERRIRQAENVQQGDARPGNFRYSDADLGGEVHTSANPEGGVYSAAQAEVFRPDGSRDTVGTVRYAVGGGEAKLYGDSMTAANYGTESALLSEVSEQARAQGADHLGVWTRDGDSAAERRWATHGFQPTERNPGAKGVQWQKRLA